MNSRSVLFLAILAIVASLTACGIKPNQLEPPPGAEGKEFPATYPAPATLQAYE